MLLKLPQKKNVCYTITDDNIVQSVFFPSNQCCESLSNVIVLGQKSRQNFIKMKQNDLLHEPGSAREYLGVWQCNGPASWFIVH